VTFAGDGTVTPNSGTVVTDGSGVKLYGADLLVSAPINVASSTPVAVGTNAPGTVAVTIPSLAGTSAGGANSAFKHDSTLLAGVYKNTLVITCLANS
jgi:hypothetical protein